MSTVQWCHRTKVVWGTTMGVQNRWRLLLAWRVWQAFGMTTMLLYTVSLVSSFWANIRHSYAEKIKSSLYPDFKESDWPKYKVTKGKQKGKWVKKKIMGSYLLESLKLEWIFVIQTIRQKLPTTRISAALEVLLLSLKVWLQLTVRGSRLTSLIFWEYTKNLP